MSAAFISSLKTLINQSDPNITASKEIDIQGNLSVGGVDTFIYVKLYVGVTSSEITIAFPSDDAVEAKDLRGTVAEIDRIKRAIEYDGTNWGTIKFSKPVWKTRIGANTTKTLISICTQHGLAFPDTSLPATGRGGATTPGTTSLRFPTKNISTCPPAGNTPFYDYLTGTPYDQFSDLSLASRVGPRAGTGASTEWRLHMFNVNSGNCSLLLCPGTQEAMIFDCGALTNRAVDNITGNHRAVDRIESILARETDINAIDVVISHGDKDHVNLLPDVFGLASVSGKLRHVFMGANLSDSQLRSVAPLVKTASGNVYETAKNSGDGAVMSTLVRPARSATTVSAGTSFNKGRFSSDIDKTDNNWEAVKTLLSGNTSTSTPSVCGGKVRFLAANETLNSNDPGSSQPNRQSVVAVIDNRVVLTADATAAPLRKAVANAGLSLPHPPILSVPHHGAATAPHFPSEWTTWANPEYLIYQAGDQNGHPNVLTYDPSVGGVADLHGFSGYKNATELLALTPSKNVFFGKTVAADDNFKTPVEISKQVFVTSDTGELVISSTDIKCVGPFAAGGGSRNILEDPVANTYRVPTYDELITANSHCIPTP